MKPIKLSLWLLLGLPVGLWLLADTLWPSPLTYFAFREVFVQLTGVVAIVAMCAAMILAVRPRWLESRLHGLDKMYRLHKWLGIAALGVSAVHWWFAQGSKWMVGWGWLSRPERHRGGGETLGIVEQFFRQQRGFAESVGEWAFYIAVVFILAALFKRVPYRLFQRTHGWIAWAFLALVYHSLVLTKIDYWAQPVGWLLGVMLVGGVVAAVIALSGRIGLRRRVGGTVEQRCVYPALNVLETEITLDSGWPGHAEGQFAFLTVDRGEGAHPFTIASDWDPAHRRMVFITKALGDYTARLPEHLEVGRRVTVEGPYGCFTFDDAQPRQIWVGAGIGITPFIARMKRLARHGDGKQIDLFHPSADVEAAAIDKLRADAEAAGVRLHLILGKGGQRLDGDIIRASVPAWREASLWFCGPAAFGHSLRTDFEDEGLPLGRFHQELFQMR